MGCLLAGVEAGEQGVEVAAGEAPVEGLCGLLKLRLEAEDPPGKVVEVGEVGAAIYGFWDDLFVDAPASIRADVTGASPNRRFVFEFRNVRFIGDTTRRIDFNVVL